MIENRREFLAGTAETAASAALFAANAAVADVLATNFGQSEALVSRFPKRDVFIADKEGKVK
jgi:hypothetical protein